VTTGGPQPPESAAAPARPRLQLLEPLRNRDFALLFGATAISLVGDGIFYVALAWQAYDLSGAASALSLVLTAMFGARLLFLLVGGAIADRFDRRRVMISADLIRAACLAVVAVLGAMDTLALWHLAVAVAVFSIGDALFLPASRALLPSLVGRDDLGRANALLSASRPITSRVVGPLLGGVAIGIGGAASGFALDSASFVLSALLLAFLRTRAVPEGHEEGASLFGEIVEGLRFVRGERWLAVSLLAAAVGLLFYLGPVSVLLPRLIKIDMGGSAVDYGIVLTAGGIGGIAGSLALGQLGLPRRRLPAMYLCWVVGALGITGFGLAGELWQLFAIELVAVAALDIGEIIWFTLLQERVPDRLLGRVGALDNFASLGLVPVSMALAGPAGDTFGTRETLLWAGVAAAGAIAAAFVLTPSLRRADAQPAGVQT
jgi:hypothetical protein